jgi:uncharacterized protein
LKKRYRFLIIPALFLGIAGYVVLVHVLPYSIIKPPRTTATNYLDNDFIEYDKVLVTSFDSIKLKGYHVKSFSGKPKASLILVHGIGGCKEHFTNLAANLSKKGYDCWLFDNRAHGESEGLYSTYGYLEKKDIKAIVDAIKMKTPETKVAIWGNSLGGAIAIQALEYDKRLEFGIIESSFANLRQIVYDYQKRLFFDIGIKFASNVALNEAGEIARFNPDEVSPIDSVKKITQPIMICHGDKDENISIEYGKALFNNLASKDKSFVLVKGGGHYSLATIGGNAYNDKLMAFLEVHSAK